MTEVERNIIEDYAKHVFDSDNVWDSEKYINSRKLEGNAFGKDALVRFQYVLGNSHLIGIVGDRYIEIFGSQTQYGYQVYTWHIDQGEKGRTKNDLRPAVYTGRFNPTAVAEFLDFIKSRLGIK